MANKIKKTQTSDVLHYLQTHKRGLTSMQAIEKFGATRLADIVFRLRKYGYEIEVETMVRKNRYGNEISFARYFMNV